MQNVLRREFLVIQVENSEIEAKFKKLEMRIVNLENIIKLQENTKITYDQITLLGKKVAEKIDKISAMELILVALHITPKQTTAEIKQMINGWGWSPDTFFEKNFGTCLINKDLCKKFMMIMIKKIIAH